MTRGLVPPLVVALPVAVCHCSTWSYLMQAIYFRMLEEVGLTNKMMDQSPSSADDYRLHPDKVSDLELYPEVFQDTILMDKMVGTCRYGRDHDVQSLAL
jgi:hypothetical protein